MAYTMSFLEATKVRRSNVTLTNTSPISDDTIVNIVGHAIKHAPSPFHVQSGRAIVLFKKEHEKLWDFGKESVMATMPPPVQATILPKVAEYRAAYGTVRYDVHVARTKSNESLLTVEFSALSGSVFRRSLRRRRASASAPRPDG